MNSASERIKKLRQRMLDQQIDFYYVPTRDDHNNEYVPEQWQRRAWLTHFTGSYGEALIGLEQAYLWTDSRYFLQAENELDATIFQLMKQLQGVAAPISHWLSEHADHKTVGVDPRVMSISHWQKWSEVLLRRQGKLKAIDENWVDAIWTNKPDWRLEKVHIYDVHYAGLSATEKLARVREAMQHNRADACVISQLDEIAWLFNIRGNDVAFNPLVISYAIITQKDAFLFVHLDCIAASDLPYFATHHITLKPYHAFASALQQFTGSVQVDPQTASVWIALQLQRASVIEDVSPIVMMKAIKNETELKNMRIAHQLDAVAVIRFLQWIDTHWRDGVDEISAADQLEKLRREEKRCLDLSFPTICGFADHGAIVHYHATVEKKHLISDQNLLLVDSGGQYFEGTTDITRTIHLGVPTHEQKKHYTLVLKGHLALRHTPFPAGVCGEHINAIARMPLWAEEYEFGHGTGHGVGCYLCVHEGPQRIAYSATNIPLQPGMIVSNEPGLYFSGLYGIRIENLCEIIEKKTASQKNELSCGTFYTMRDLTLVPYARKLIDVNLLSSIERQWINDYHREISNTLAERVADDVRHWLKAETAPL